MFSIHCDSGNVEILKNGSPICAPSQGEPDAPTSYPKIAVKSRIDSIFQSIKAQFLVFISLFYGERLTRVTIDIRNDFFQNSLIDRQSYLATAVSVEKYVKAELADGVFYRVDGKAAKNYVQNSDGIDRKNYLFESVITIEQARING